MKEKLLTNMLNHINSEMKIAAELADRSEKMSLSQMQRTEASKRTERFLCNVHMEVSTCVHEGLFSREEADALLQLSKSVEATYKYALM